MVNGSVVQLPGQALQAQGLALAPLTPPAHELEQPHPLYGQPHIQVQHGVLVKAPPGAASHLTTLSHPGTPPDTPPVSASPPPLQLHRGDRDSRDRSLFLHLQQPSSIVQDDMQAGEGFCRQPGVMGWLTQSLRQEPLDLRPHCPQEQTPEPHHEAWPSAPMHHHFQDPQHLQRHTKHTGECRNLFRYFRGFPTRQFDYFSVTKRGFGRLKQGRSLREMDFVFNASASFLNHFFLLYCISLLLERLLRSREVRKNRRWCAWTPVSVLRWRVSWNIKNPALVWNKNGIHIFQI